MDKTAHRAPTHGPWRFVCRIAGILALVFVTSYCTRGEKQTEIMQLSPDESYLVDAYVRVREATELSYVSPSKSDSLFAVLDSTLDTLRISNAVRELNQHPDRWVLVFRSIEEKTQRSSEPVGPEDPVSE